MGETFTPNLHLSKFAQGERFPVVSAVKLNANWTAIDAAIQALITGAATESSTRSSADTAIAAAAQAYTDAKLAARSHSATFVVAATGGNYTTIEAAVAAAPVAGADIYVREGSYSPAATIVLPTDRDIRIRAAGAIGLTIVNVPTNAPLFSAASGAREYAFSGFKVVGDSTIDQRLISLNTAAEVEFEDLEVTGIRVLVDVASTAPEVSFRRCSLSMPNIDNISFWLSSTGGSLIWEYVEATVLRQSTIAITGAPDWTVVTSYVGIVGPPAKSTYTCGIINFIGFKIDKASIHETVDGSRVVNCRFIDATLFLESNASTVEGSIFTSPTLSGAQLSIWGNGTPAIAVSGCVFLGNSNADQGIQLIAATGVTITGCYFKGHSTDGIDIGPFGAVAAVVAGCYFEESAPVIEGNSGTVAVTYSGNNTLAGSTLRGKSTVDGRKTISATGTSTNSLVAFVNLSAGTNMHLDGFGTLKNTGAQSIDVKETVTDLFGQTKNVTTTVTSGSQRALSARADIDTARAPYSAYKVEVVSTAMGTPSTFEIHFGSHGQI